jgi:CO/xanthine dehydrogenase Mo-binding subunit
MPKSSPVSTVGVLDDRAGHSFKMSAKLNIGGDSFRASDGFRAFLWDLYRGKKKFPSPLSFYEVGRLFCEVEVNMKTGEVKGVCFLGTNDSGRVMNRMTFACQVYGGITIIFLLTEIGDFDTLASQ